MRALGLNEVTAVAGGLVGGGYGPGGTPLYEAGSASGYCTWAPDTPMGFAFGEACRAHDKCFDEGGGFATCNAAFYTTLLQVAGGTIVGEALAALYAAATFVLGWAWYGFPPQNPFEGPNGG